MKFRGTLILGVLALAMGAYIYFIEIKKTAKDEEIKAASEKIVDLDSAKVKAIKLNNTFGEITLEKNPQNQWTITSPVKDSADEPTVTGMLSSLTSEKFDQVVSENNADFKTYGLDQPKMSVTLTGANGETKKINLGIDATLPGKLYLQRDGENRVLFANQAFKLQVDKPLKDLRDKRIFRKNKNDVSFISIDYRNKSGHSHVDLAKNDSGWNLEKPFKEKADTETVQGFMTNVENLRATDFPSEKSGDKSELRKFSLDKPEMILTYKDKDGKVIDEMTVGPKKENNAYVTSSEASTVYQVYVSAAEQLVHKPEDFRDKKTPFEFNKDSASEITVKTGMVNLDLVKKGDSWELAQPDPRKTVSQIQVTNLLDKLSQFKVSEFFDKGKGLHSPKGTVILKDQKGETLLSLNWGEKTPSQRGYFVQTNKGKGVYGVEASLLDTLPGQTLVEAKTEASNKKPAEASSKPPLPESKGPSH